MLEGWWDLVYDWGDAGRRGGVQVWLGAWPQEHTGPGGFCPQGLSCVLRRCCVSGRVFIACMTLDTWRDSVLARSGVCTHTRGCAESLGCVR